MLIGTQEQQHHQDDKQGADQPDQDIAAVSGFQRTVPCVYKRRGLPVRCNDPGITCRAGHIAILVGFIFGNGVNGTDGDCFNGDGLIIFKGNRISAFQASAFTAQVGIKLVFIQGDRKGKVLIRISQTP